MRRAILVAILTLTTLATVPTANAAAYPLTPDPAECDAEPIDVDALLDRADLVAGPGTPTAVGTVRVASLAVQDDLMEVVVGSLACTNANQPLRALSSFTEDYLLHRISEEPVVTLGHLKAAGTREPQAAEPQDRVTVEMIEMSTVWDGGAEIVLLWSSGEQHRVRTGLRFRDVGGEWKIDEVLGETVDD